MTKLYIRKIPDRQKNKRIIKSCITDLVIKDYVEFLEEHRVDKILRVYVKKIHEDYSSVALLVENTSQEVKVIMVNDNDYKMPE